MSVSSKIGMTGIVRGRAILDLTFGDMDLPSRDKRQRRHLLPEILLRASELFTPSVMADYATLTDGRWRAPTRLR